MASVDISGVEAVIARLGSVPQKIRAKGFRTATGAVGRAAAKDLKGVVPRATGALYRSISSRMLRKRGGEEAAVKIGGIKRGKGRVMQDHVLRFLEDGTKRHMVKGWTLQGGRLKKIDTQTLRKMNSAGQVAPKYWMHPGIKARYLLRKLTQQRMGNYAEVLEKAMGAYLTKVGL